MERRDVTADARIDTIGVCGNSVRGVSLRRTTVFSEFELSNRLR